jgi:hypothetical protein
MPFKPPINEPSYPFRHPVRECEYVDCQGTCLQRGHDLPQRYAMASTPYSRNM